MKSALIVKTQAQLTVALIAGAITQTSALLLSFTVDLSADTVSPTALVLYGAATVLLIYRWVVFDARRAFCEAVKKRQVVLEGSPPHITWICPVFAGRWLARLHIRLHPELGEDKAT
ncbi:hypothetical protein [Paraburkholderia rhynchosiae]|uniref:Uncharacterized protein n=1 Tax=Paraburkholderia rhynchosiae TaxID=487049 RepID=A0A2N7VKX9_9BURK|nr:hypothetical protein [Paraburkholderia rhynchosiae]PMS17799.1 hypothetical protein C0Z16_36340 [Paraburkholderia rhynchosiae]CAB3744423.1 hypothetical protein LMG27174_07175 [Paraburkholderia rhynchosiae]